MEGESKSLLFVYTVEGQPEVGPLTRWARTWEIKQYGNDVRLSYVVYTMEEEADPVRWEVKVTRCENTEDGDLLYLIEVPGTSEQVFVTIDGRA